MNPRARWWPCATLTGVVLCFSAPSAWAETTIEQPYEGVTLVVHALQVPRPVRVRVVEVDLRAPGVGVRLTPHGGSRDSVRQTTLDFLLEQRAQVAINAHFFVPFPSTERDANLVGLAASDGHVYSPFEPQPVLAGAADQSYAIVPFAPALNVDANNHASIVHHEAGGPNAHHVREPVRLWTAVAGSAQIVTDGARTLPRYDGSRHSLTANQRWSGERSWYDVPRARTAIGLARGGHTLVLLTADEAGGSEGMTVSEVADLLIGEHAVWAALNVDGGGSTTLAMQDPVSGVGRIINAPVEGPHGRAVGSNLAIFAKRRSDAVNVPAAP